MSIRNSKKNQLHKTKNNSNMKETKTWRDFEQLSRAKALKQKLWYSPGLALSSGLMHPSPSYWQHQMLTAPLCLLHWEWPSFKELPCPRLCSLQDSLRLQLQPHCTSASPSARSCLPHFLTSHLPQFLIPFPSSPPCEWVSQEHSSCNSLPQNLFPGNPI